MHDLIFYLLIMKDKDQINKHALKFDKRNAPRILNIKGYDLTYNDHPLKGNFFRYRGIKVRCSYFVKIEQNNIEKINKNENAN